MGMGKEFLQGGRFSRVIPATIKTALQTSTNSSQKCRDATVVFSKTCFTHLAFYLSLSVYLGRPHLRQTLMNNLLKSTKEFLAYQGTKFQLLLSK